MSRSTSLYRYLHISERLRGLQPWASSIRARGRGSPQSSKSLRAERASVFLARQYASIAESVEPSNPKNLAYRKRGSQSEPRISQQSSKFALDLETSKRTVNHPQNQARLPEDTAVDARVGLLVRAYQAIGHRKAKTDPLGLREIFDTSILSDSEELNPENYGFTKSDMDRAFALGPGVLDRFISDDSKIMTLRDIISTLEKAYCSTYGVEYMHITNKEKCDWIRDRIEIPKPIAYSKEEKQEMLSRTIRSATFENLMGTKFPNRKRYGLDGAESYIVGLEALIDRSIDAGVGDIVIGSQHRGRVNAMCNILSKPARQIFYEFSSRSQSVLPRQVCDRFLHFGQKSRRTTSVGNTARISIVANPSHLESEDPVAAGQARATHLLKKLNMNDWSKTMCLMIHGDGAVTGQGIVYETFGLSNLEDYSTGGTIHIIVNNQVGFTTDPHKARSTPYCSDIAKAFDCPVFHVNADDVEAVTRMCEIAADWRATFHTDCVVDLVCYRKFGHNELDQPRFTQPLMYEKVAQKMPVLDQYQKKLTGEGAFTSDSIKREREESWRQLENEYEASQTYEPSLVQSQPDGKITTDDWSEMKTIEELSTRVFTLQSTGIETSAVDTVASAFSSTATPPEFKLHRTVERLFDSRSKALKERGDVDWSTAESLALGSLCMEGHHVRISGQDVERGTFSQRHAVTHNQNLNGVVGDQSKTTSWIPLDNLTSNQGRFTAANSPLGEYAVLGYEYGYSLASPKILVMWEAQFGDFANNAQCIIDQFIVSGEAKWLQPSGLVLSLPHGYDGQGPEHSSARIERYLQLCSGPWEFPENGDDLVRAHQTCNIQVVNVTTPANLFHVLRRQMLRPFRKPLILLWSKSLLRHPLTKSPLENFLGDSKFHPVIRDPEVSLQNVKNIRKIILCSGQVYAKLFQYRSENAISDTAITRVEELHPFPWSEIRDEIDSYPDAREMVWCQEEPMNQGAWSYVSPRLESLLRKSKYHNDKRVAYAGRPPSASTATGYKAIHDVEEVNLMQTAFGI